MNKEIIKTYIISTIVLLILDYIYFYIIDKPLKNLILKTQKSKLELNYMGAILCYIVITLNINYFIFYKKATIIESFLLGSSIYAIFDLTNMAFLKTWNGTIVRNDIMWGGLLYSLTTIITNYINKNINI